MGLAIIFVSGPRLSGKSAVIRTMLDHLWRRPPHYIRLIQTGGDKPRPQIPATPPRNCGVASARLLEYSPDRIFEILPTTLTAIHRQDRFGTVVIEADADPVLRCAYPYDHRVFTMPVPATVNEVFRTTQQAADELRRVLDDTQAFASEIFGLLSDQGVEDCDPREDRVDLTATQMRGFLYSPLGDELATRIQLQPPYHGLAESDVVVMNTESPGTNGRSQECVKRIGLLLERMRTISGHRGRLFICDPRNLDDQITSELLESLRPMCDGGV